MPEGEILERRREEVLAGAVVGDVRPDGGDHAERRRRLVPQVGLHHGWFCFAAISAMAVAGGEWVWLSIMVGFKGFRRMESINKGGLSGN